MSQKNTLDLTQGPIVKRLFSFALPIFFMLLLQQFYNAADRAVVGRFAENGKDALAAIGATGAITALVLHVKTGLASGANVHCGNLRGAGDQDSLRKGMHTSIWMAVISGVVLGALGIAISRPVLIAMGTPEGVLADAVLYMRVYMAGLPAMSLYNFCTAIMRSNGDTKRPLYILVVSGIVNVVLNLIFVIVFKMRVAGVAIATVAAQALSAVRLLKILFDPKDAYKLSFKELRITKRSALEIARIGIPAGINGMFINFANVTLQVAINSFGDAAILAGKTVTTDVANMLNLILHGFSLGCVSFAAQCYGAKKYKRIDRLAITTLLCGCGMLLPLVILALVFSKYVIGIFNNDPAVIAVGQSMLPIHLWGLFLHAVSDVLSNCAKGMGKSAGTTFTNLIGDVVPRILWVWLIFPIHPTVAWLYMCLPFAWMTGSVFQLGYYIYIRRKLDKELVLETAQ